MTRKGPGEKISIRLGDGAASVAEIDAFPIDSAVEHRRVKGGTVYRGTREQLLGILYIMESCPAYSVGGGSNGWDGEPWGVSAITRAVKKWRNELAMEPGDRTPVPAWAQQPQSIGGAS